MNTKLQKDELVTEVLDIDPNAQKIKTIEEEINKIDKKMKSAKNKYEKKALKTKREKLLKEYEETQKLMETIQ